MKLKLQKAISEVVKSQSSLKLKVSDVVLEHPENQSFGDYSSNISLRTKIPAEKIKQGLEKGDLSSLVERIEIKNGFINFFLKEQYLLGELGKVLELGDKYGSLGVLDGKKIMVEFAHPNTHKQFHIGHMRNIVLGESMVRILEVLGAKIIRANYQGDVGLHIAKALWGIKKTGEDWQKIKGINKRVEFLGKAYALGSKAYGEDKKVKKEILGINKKIYSQEDKEINSLWKETRQWSLDYFEEIYSRVYSSFDRFYFEGEVYQKGREVVLKGLEKGIFKKSKGAIIFPGSEHGLHDRVFITSEGNPTYEAKDMELARLQFEEHNPDLIIHNVGPEQSGYFKVIFKALEELFPQTKGKEYHLAYGWVRLKKGKMSSRSGNVVTGPWLIDEAKKRIKKAFPEVNEETAEKIAVGAVKYSFLRVNPSTEVVFDFDESISLQGNSGPYLQYTYARCQSVLAKAKKKEIKYQKKVKSTKLNSEELAVLRTIYQFPEVVELAGQSYAPNLICNFLYDLAQKYNGFYNQHRIIKAKDKDVLQFRLELTAGVAKVIKNGLNLLGIKAPEKM